MSQLGSDADVLVRDRAEARRTMKPAARALGMLIVLGWGWYIAATFRTQQLGFSAAVLGVAALFVLPAAFLPFIGLRWRTTMLGAVATVLVVLLAVEAFAAVEESAFRRATRTLPPDAAIVTQARQWPFAHHSMSYDPGSGRWWGGD